MCQILHGVCGFNDDDCGGKIWENVAVDESQKILKGLIN